MRSPGERFWMHVEIDATGCWLWTGGTQKGYGEFFLPQGRRRMVRSHRYAYEQIRGPIPPGLDLDHLCRVRACVNPAHLEPVTRRENLLRGLTLPADESQRTHCKHGHPFDEKNTGRHRGASGIQRRCRPCDADRHRVKRKRLALEGVA